MRASPRSLAAFAVTGSAGRWGRGLRLQQLKQQLIRGGSSSSSGAPAIPLKAG